MKKLEVNSLVSTFITRMILRIPKERRLNLFLSGIKLAYDRSAEGYFKNLYYIHIKYIK